MLGLVRGQRGRLVGAVLLGAGATAASVALLATSAWLISKAALHPNVQSLAVAVVGVRFFGLSRGLLRYAERLVGHDATLRSLADLRVRVYGRLERLAPAGLPAFRRGDLLARLVRDVDAQQDLVLRVVSVYAVAAVTGAAVVVLTGWLEPAVGVLLAMCLVLASTVPPSVTRLAARRTEQHRARLRGAYAEAVVDLLDGRDELVACGAAQRRLHRLDVLDAALTRADRRAALGVGAGTALGLLLVGVAVWGAVVLGLGAVADGRLDGVLLAVVVLVPLASLEVVSGLPAAALAYDSVRGASARVLDVLDAPDPVPEPAHPRALPDDIDLRLRHVSARWPEQRWPGQQPAQPTAADRPALVDADLDLPRGRRVALVGPSGSGKSTLAAVLVRFLPYSGSARTGGVELAALDDDDVRRRVGLAAQDAHVFDTTIAANLRVGRPDATDDALWAALAEARLDDWVATLPDGLATRVGEHGAAMSGGQRQRLVVARALLADPPVLVLDEPGEHLDAATADALTHDVLDATRGRTVLLVTHRTAGLEQVDEVVALGAAPAQAASAQPKNQED
jgi:thiol reductant ABC exporter CydC subunit